MSHERLQAHSSLVSLESPICFWKGLIAILLFALSSAFVGATDITSCSTLDSAGVYNLTADVSISGDNSCINITGDSVTFFCSAGHQIFANDAYSVGIYVNASHAVVKNCFVNGKYIAPLVVKGVYLTSDAFNGSLVNNTVNNTAFAFVIESNNATIKNNSVTQFSSTITDDKYGLFLSGTNATVTYNNLTGVCSGVWFSNYIVSTNDLSVSHNLLTLSNSATYCSGGALGNGFTFSTSDGVNVFNNEIYGGEYSIYFGGSAGTKGVYIEDNLLMSAANVGFQASSSSRGVRLNSNYIENNHIGVSLPPSSSDYILFNNTIKTVDFGVTLNGASNSTLLNNTITTNGSTYCAIRLTSSAKNNTVVNNSVSSAGAWGGIRLDVGDVTNNTLYNNLINSTHPPVTFSGLGNVFNNFSAFLSTGTNIIGGANVGGNFYANYSSSGGYSFSCADFNENGVCDSPYVLGVAANNSDFYPLSSVISLFPTFYNNGSNSTSVKKGGGLVLSINATDNGFLSFITAHTNFTGEWVNQSVFANVSSFNTTFSVTTNQSRGKQIAYEFYVNDTAGNMNFSALSTLTVSNTAPAINDLKLNNGTSILSGQDVNVSWNFSDVDNDSQAGFSVRWFVNGINVSSADDKNILLSNNVSSGNKVWATVNVSDGYDSSSNLNITNTSVVTIGDNIAPSIDNLTLNATSFYSDEWIGISVNCSDAASSISFVYFTVNNSAGTLENKTGIGTTPVFSYANVWGVGTYTIPFVFCGDTSGNVNVSSFSSTFIVASRPSGGTGSSGGGGSSGCPTGYANVAGVCVPIEEINQTSNATATCNNNGVCDVLLGEDCLNCRADCGECNANYWTCTAPGEPCFWTSGSTALYVLLGIGVVALIYLWLRS